MQSLRSHGIIRNKKNMKVNKLPDYYYEQHHLGFNYRMNDISAALGISQLKKLDKFVKKKKSSCKNL